MEMPDEMESATMERRSIRMVCRNQTWLMPISRGHYMSNSHMALECGDYSSNPIKGEKTTGRMPRLGAA